MVHRHITTGLPCNCTFTKHLRKTAKVASHSQLWEPGWPGKGFYHNGQLTTWGVNSTNHTFAWPHHAKMWEQKYPGENMIEAMKGENPALLLNIEPDGQVREAHPFKGDYAARIAEVHQIEPRFKQQEPEDWNTMFSKTADWYDDAWESPFPEHIEPWQPPHPGKGLVSPEGRAYTWKVDGPYDGYPSHAQGLQAVGVPGSNDNQVFQHALNHGWSFYDVEGDGNFRRALGPAEHEPIMKAHMPQEVRCAGCGSAVEVDGEGEYNCPHCRWRGVTDRGKEQTWDNQFS